MSATTIKLRAPSRTSRDRRAAHRADSSSRPHILAQAIPAAGRVPSVRRPAPLRINRNPLRALVAHPPRSLGSFICYIMPQRAEALRQGISPRLGSLAEHNIRNLHCLVLSAGPLLQCFDMTDWRQIQARIRKAKNSPDAHTKLSELFQRTRDGMVAWELGCRSKKKPSEWTKL